MPMPKLRCVNAIARTSTTVRLAVIVRYHVTGEMSPRLVSEAGVAHYSPVGSSIGESGGDQRPGQHHALAVGRHRVRGEAEVGATGTRRPSARGGADARHSRPPGAPPDRGSCSTTSRR